MNYCEETRTRIRISVAAYAYEVMSDPIMSDAEFDKLCRQVNLEAETARPDMDVWFKQNFVPDTGMWIWNHPDLEGLHSVYMILTAKSPWETFFRRFLAC